MASTNKAKTGMCGAKTGYPWPCRCMALVKGSPCVKHGGLKWVEKHHGKAAAKILKDAQIGVTHRKKPKPKPLKRIDKLPKKQRNTV